MVGIFLHLLNWMDARSIVRLIVWPAHELLQTTHPVKVWECPVVKDPSSHASGENHSEFLVYVLFQVHFLHLLPPLHPHLLPQRRFSKQVLDVSGERFNSRMTRRVKKARFIMIDNLFRAPCICSEHLLDLKGSEQGNILLIIPLQPLHTSWTEGTFLNAPSFFKMV